MKINMEINQEMIEKIKKKMTETQKMINNDNSNLSFPDGHWSSLKFVNGNILTDSLVKHLLGLCYYKMADTGEIFETLAIMQNSDEESWCNAWAETAKKTQSDAENYEQKQKTFSAASAYLRASTYWRASMMYFSCNNDTRIKEYTANSHNCYEKYIKYSGYPGEYIEIPYENTFLPGHFYRSSSSGEKAPLLIITPGRDTWAEDTRWIYDTAVKRGIHCLIYDGPGQGYALRLQDLPFRPDWENVITPVIDYALTLPGIDPERIGLMGLSFGGFLVPRAAAFDKRIKLCIADPGNINWGGTFAQIFSILPYLPKEMIPAHMSIMMHDYAWKHGVSEENIAKELLKYDNSDILNEITCKMLVLDGTAEINPGEAVKFYDALKNCPKEYYCFDEKSTSQCHCQMGSYAPAAEILLNWIEDNI